MEARIPVVLADVSYTDPATRHPPPAAREVDHVWADDDAPPGWKITASPGASTRFVTRSEGPVFAGNRALRRQDPGLAQDVFEAGPQPLEIPSQARLFAQVWLDPANPPKSIMLQYRTGEWKHRAVWGDYDAIDSGRARHDRARAPRRAAEVRRIGPARSAGRRPRPEGGRQDPGFRADAVSAAPFAGSGR